MALKKTQNDFRHKTSEAYLRRGEEKKNLRNIWLQDTGENTYFRTAWSKDRNRVESNVRGGVCAAEAAHGWVLEPNTRYFHVFRKSLFFTKPPFLLRRGGCTTQLYLKAYLAQTVFLGAYIRVHF